MERRVYLELFNDKKAMDKETLFVKDVARLEGKREIVSQIEQLPVYTPTKKDENYVVIDVLTILQHIHSALPDIHVIPIGPKQTVIEIAREKQPLSPLFVLFFLLLLYIGSALAIMNFHEDVSMLLVHQKLYLFITGKELAQPLLLQIPYSIGLGLGMIIFFNHIFKKRINEEPSPLDIEIFQYKKGIEDYLSATETDRSSKPWPSKHSPQ